MKKLLCSAALAFLVCALAAGCGSRSGAEISKAGGSSSAAASSQAAVGPFVAGTMDETVYTSAFAGFSFTLPENWVFATAEEALALLGTTEDMLAVPGETYEHFDNDLNSVYDMVAGERYTNASSLFIAFEDATAYLGGTSMTEADYAEAFWTAASDPEVNEAYAEIAPAISTAALAGADWTVYQIDLTETYNMTQTLYFRKIGNYFCSLTYTCTGVPDQAAFAALFAPAA